MTEAVQTKYCTGCERDRPLGDFRKCTRCNDGIQSRCRECISKVQAALYRRKMGERGDELRAIWKENHQRQAARPKVDPGDAKFCTGCETVKPVAEFNQKSSSLDGLHPNCKECRRLSRHREGG